ncbi:MAG TPA: hypothetical protein PLK95_03585, partial [Pseudothermotoga sp.]|nr:hypothetical protein [Pseudothermotoga sp.]HPP69798.1 hypothetical protein [Pseudothermotoga sp.]
EGMEQLRKEMIAFKNEMAELNKKRDQNMEEFKREMAELNKKREQGMEEFKKEMLSFKNEMAELNKKRDQSMEEFKRETAELNKKREQGMEEFKKEMLSFKNEMAELNKKRDQSMEEFKKEMAELNKKRDQSMEEFKKEMLSFKNEMAELNKKRDQSMEEFKREMAELNRRRELGLEEYKKKVDQDIQEMRRQWGNLANKMGTLVEDIFAPSIPQAIKRYFGCDPDTVIQRYYTRDGHTEIEIDLLVLCKAEGKAFVTEVKSSPDRVKYIEEFIQKSKILKDLVPILKEYEIVPIYAGLSLNENTVNLLTRSGIYAMVLKGDILEIVNFDQVNK